MIEIKHYIAHWMIFDINAYFNGAHQSFFIKTERFISRKEAEKKVSEELEKFKACTEQISSTKWFKEWYLDKIDEYFRIDESHKIY